MNLDNSTFLGEFDDHYLVKMLDGTVFEMRYNLINEDDLLDVVVDAAQSVGIVLRKHRLRAVLDETNDRTYWVFQEPPKVSATWLDTNGVLSVELKRNHDVFDALDYFSSLGSSSRPCPHLHLSSSSHGHSTTRELWKLLSVLYRPVILDVGYMTMDNEMDILKLFAECDVQELRIMSLSDRHVDFLCNHMKSLRTLRITDRVFQTIREEWGKHLCASTHVAEIHFCRADVRDERELKGWSDWQIRSCIRREDIQSVYCSIELGRFSFTESYNALIDVDEVFT